MEVNGQLYAPAAGTHSVGGWVGLRVCLDAVKKWKILPLPEIEPRPAIPLLYSLSYPVEAGEWKDEKEGERMSATGRFSWREFWLARPVGAMFVGFVLWRRWREADQTDSKDEWLDWRNYSWSTSWSPKHQQFDIYAELMELKVFLSSCPYFLYMLSPCSFISLWWRSKWFYPVTKAFLSCSVCSSIRCRCWCIHFEWRHWIWYDFNRVLLCACVEASSSSTVIW
jgi:hypothetical protein